MKFFYWFTTVLFSFGISMSGVGYLAGLQSLLDGLVHLGYPAYFRYILGSTYIIGAIILAIPTMEKLKEWAYAGFTFALLTSFYSHIASGDNFDDIKRHVLLFVLLVISYFTFQRVEIPGKSNN